MNLPRVTLPNVTRGGLSVSILFLMLVSSAQIFAVLSDPVMPIALRK